MIIPPDQLSAEALNGLVEEFITREGTDYGCQEMDLTTKVEQVRTQLDTNEVMIIFDTATESVNLMTTSQYKEWLLLSKQKSS